MSAGTSSLIFACMVLSELSSTLPRSRGQLVRPLAHFLQGRIELSTGVMQPFAGLFACRYDVLTDLGTDAAQGPR